MSFRLLGLASALTSVSSYLVYLAYKQYFKKTFKSSFRGLVGNTKMVELKSLSALTGCIILAKVEYLNPGGKETNMNAQV